MMKKMMCFAAILASAVLLMSCGDDDDSSGNSKVKDMCTVGEGTTNTCVTLNNTVSSKLRKCTRECDGGGEECDKPAHWVETSSSCPSGKCDESTGECTELVKCDYAEDCSAGKSCSYTCPSGQVCSPYGKCEDSECSSNAECGSKFCIDHRCIECSVVKDGQTIEHLDSDGNKHECDSGYVCDKGKCKTNG